ncbi:MAG: cytochrome c maturation protein CcmE [bacterium]|jgi:cytochrome c-type biogenesis protein CcmE|nr:cytochrome c maturation protein CcmE [Candidatus Neomarinimicrobiota bacterium]HIL86693.1 cytochrome c maturation protein CcmE [Candidatus Neomarinimicrobiota bacterium]
MNKIYTSLILVFALIVMWTVYLTNVKNDDSLTVRYYTIEELLTKEASITKVKVGGLIKPDSISINETDQLEVSFYIYQGSDSLKVYYYGIRPDLFKDDAEVVVAGAFDDNLIIATELQTKCASRYEGDLKNIEKI